LQGVDEAAELLWRWAHPTDAQPAQPPEQVGEPG